MEASGYQSAVWLYQHSSNIFCVQQKKETQLQGEQVMTEYNILINCPFNSFEGKTTIPLLHGSGQSLKCIMTLLVVILWLFLYFSVESWVMLFYLQDFLYWTLLWKTCWNNAGWWLQQKHMASISFWRKSVRFVLPSCCTPYPYHSFSAVAKVFLRLCFGVWFLMWF